MNTTKKSTADAAAVVTKRKEAKIAVKKTAKQAAAEQDEAVQKIKEKKKAKVKATIKEEATKAEQAMSAEDAAPAKAAKENAAVQTWPGLNSDSAPWPGWVTVELCARRFRPPQLPPPPGTNACGADVCGSVGCATLSGGMPLAPEDHVRPCLATCFIHSPISIL